MMTIYHRNGETWLICGGRDFSDQTMFDNAMADIMGAFGCPDTIVHGSARGADHMAHCLGQRLALNVIAVPADWKERGRAAGPIRNQFMLDNYKPTRVIAFPGGRGTADMVERARKTATDVIEIQKVEKPANWT